MQTPNPKALYGEESTGCWIDNCRGIYMGARIIETAIQHGFEPGDTDGFDPADPDYEHYHELTGEAEDYMQKLAAPGYWFGYSESFGDWGLWECEED